MTQFLVEEAVMAAYHSERDEAERLAHARAEAREEADRLIARAKGKEG